MPRLAVIVVAAAIVFWIYTIVDCALFDRLRVRGLAKGWWVAIAVLLPVVGGVLWFMIGRGRRSAVRSHGGQFAPDDDPEFLRRLGTDAQQEDRIRRLEQELAELDDETDASGPTAPEHPAEPGDPGAGHPSRGDRGPRDAPDSGDSPGRSHD
ncbi:PLD nuclease N-terminal domain-containing protein [Agromyces soli]